MNALLILIPIALLLGLLGLAGFLWSMRNGQFDDLDGAGSRILFDDVLPRRSAGTRETNAARESLKPYGGKLWKKQ